MDRFSIQTFKFSQPRKLFRHPRARPRLLKAVRRGRPNPMTGWIFKRRDCLSGWPSNDKAKYTVVLNQIC